MFSIILEISGPRRPTTGISGVFTSSANSNYRGMNLVFISGLAILINYLI